MANIQPDQRDQSSAGLTLNLSSNNPFRNRIVSAGVQSPVTSPFDDPVPERPVSRNPFLDPSPSQTRSLTDLRSSDTFASMATTLVGKETPTPEDLFDALTLDEQRLVPPRPSGAKPSQPVNRRPPGGREHLLPPGARRGPPPSHRPTKSQEEALRARKMQASGLGRNDLSHSPQRRTDRRPRRNSDSSVSIIEAERSPATVKGRERERRHQLKEKKPFSNNRKLDIIDQLDATSIYGFGAFHHEGPFDALNPNRNRKGKNRDPIQAFPEDSLNNTIGGSGPLNARPDHSTFMGVADEEAFKDYATGKKDSSRYVDFQPHRVLHETPIFDPLRRDNILHGDQTLGLGTSTFLEGTPAARTAIQRREQERQADMAKEAMQRKKSFAHRIRNINRGSLGFQPSGRMTNPEGIRRSPSDAYTATPSSMQSSSTERNPFFQEFGPDDNKGEESVSVHNNADSGEEPMSPTNSSRSMGLERRATTDSVVNPDDNYPKQGNGLLARVKSLKGGKRMRPTPPGVAPPGPPGQAA